MPRVLVIDDEAGIRFALKRWFERQQWQVAEAHDGQRAMELIEASPREGDGGFDLIVCDLNLPFMTGAEIMATLHRDRPPLAMRLILTTGDNVQDAAPTSILSTHPHVLQKPFDLVMLRDTIVRIIGA